MAGLAEFELAVRSEMNDDSIRYVQDVKGGIVNRAALFKSDDKAETYFIKYHEGPQDRAQEMFSTERFSLELLYKSGLVQVPKSIKLFGMKKYGFEGGIHVLQYIENLEPLKDHWSLFGEQIAKLHSLNSVLRKMASRTATSIHGNDCPLEPVEQFGSSVPHYIGTFCPRLGWRDTWQEYFIGDILNPLCDGLDEKYGNRTVADKWSSIKLDLHKVFELDAVQPEINHGDLCPANFGQTEKGPILFDPSVDYAHSEFDLILAKTEGGFHDDFFTSYHKILPQTPGFDDRQMVYELFYSVVMWYHVPDEQYRDKTLQSLNKVQELLQKYSSL